MPASSFATRGIQVQGSAGPRTGFIHFLGGPATQKLDIWGLAVTVRELAGWKIKATTHEAVMAQDLSILPAWGRGRGAW